MLYLFLILAAVSCKELFLYHDQQDEEIEIFKFFHDVDDGYYVDIGGFDPVFISNTINLYAKGWNGVNVEANYDRYSQFPLLRPFDVNLNLAISDKQQYLTFYEYFVEPTQSTASPKVYSGMDKKGFSQFQVPSMGMKQLCHRYFKKRPNLMSLDIQGFSGLAIKSNDWNNSLCRPQIIILQKDNIPDTIKFIVSNKQFMAQQGYTYHSQSLFNQYFIENVTYDYFIAKYKQGTKLLAETKTTVRWYLLLTQFYRYLKVPEVIQQAKRSNNRGGHFFYHYPKQNTLVSLQNLNKMSNELTDKKDRPILILKFNPLNTKIVIESNYTKSKMRVKQWEFQKFVVTKGDGAVFQVYIFLTYQQEIQPYIMELASEVQRKQKIDEEKKVFVIPKQKQPQVKKQIQNLEIERNKTKQNADQSENLKKQTNIIISQKQQKQNIAQNKQDLKIPSMGSPTPTQIQQKQQPYYAGLSMKSSSLSPSAPSGPSGAPPLSQQQQTKQLLSAIVTTSGITLLISCTLFRIYLYCSNKNKNTQQQQQQIPSSTSLQ